MATYIYMKYHGALITNMDKSHNRLESMGLSFLYLFKLTFSKKITFLAILIFLSKRVLDLPSTERSCYRPAYPAKIWQCWPFYLVIHISPAFHGEQDSRVNGHIASPAVLAGQSSRTSRIKRHTRFLCPPVDTPSFVTVCPEALFLLLPSRDISF